MKTYRNLWDQISTFETLHAAYLKARRGKRYDADTLRFSANLEQEIGTLVNELQSGSYKTGEYRCFNVFEPKKREVAALPFRDRVVQHALVAATEPIFELRFSHDSYACRVGKGTHAGADRLTDFLRRAGRMWQNVYILKADISKYFSSIDHASLKTILRRKIACPKTLELMDSIIDSWNAQTGKGLPIGNLTSQLFANIYLNELDQFVKQELHWRFYARYMDDFVLVDDDKAKLNNAKRAIQEFLHLRLSLELNPKTRIFPAELGVDFLGYRIWKTHRLLRKRCVIGMRRKLKAFQTRYARGEIGQDDIQASIMSWLGHAKHANTYTLQKKLFGNFILRR